MKQRLSLLFLMGLLLICTKNSLSKEDFDATKPIGETKISGHLHGLEGDTLILTYWQDAVYGSRYRRPFPPIVQKVAVAKDGMFSFKLPVYRSIQYFSLESNLKKRIWQEEDFFHDGEMKDVSKSTEVPVLYLDNFILEPGDDIRLSLRSGALGFSGIGAEKLKCLDEIYHSPEAPKIFQIMAGDSLAVMKRLEYYTINQKFALDVLQRYEKQLSPLAYQVMQSDIVGYNQYSAYDTGSSFGWKDVDKRKAMLHLYQAQLMDKPIPLVDEISSEALGLSRYFPVFLKKRLGADDEYRYWLAYKEGQVVQRSRIKKTVFELIQTHYKGFLADKLLTLHCFDALKTDSQEDLEYYLGNSLSNLQDSSLKIIVRRFQEDFSRGELAYDFNMEDADGNTVRLSDFRGKVVFLDMWFTGCGACKSVAEAMRDEVDPYFKDNNDVVLLSVSIDKNKRMWMNSITKDAQRDPELSYQWPGAHYSGDKTIYLRTLNGSDDPFIKKYVTVGYPTLMLIDREGKIFEFSAQRPDNGREQLLIDQINEALDES